LTVSRICRPREFKGDCATLASPDSGTLHKVTAGYHQFHAVNAAVEETVRASGMTETGGVLRKDAGTYWSGRQRGGELLPL